MKMSSHFACCEKCFDDIAKTKTSASKLWLDLCNIMLIRGEIFRIAGEDIPELRMLELKGYLYSTDLPRHIIVKINGHMKTEDDEDFFCIKPDKHHE